MGDKSFDEEGGRPYIDVHHPAVVNTGSRIWVGTSLVEVIGVKVKGAMPCWSAGVIPEAINLLDAESAQSLSSDNRGVVNENINVLAAESLQSLTKDNLAAILLSQVSLNQNCTPPQGKYVLLDDVGLRCTRLRRVNEGHVRSLLGQAMGYSSADAAASRRSCDDGNFACEIHCMMSESGERVCAEWERQL